MAQYYLVKGNEKLGPFTVEQLLSNGLMPDSLVWCAGMTAWTKAAEVSELASCLAPPATPQPPATPEPPVMQQAPAMPAAPANVQPPVAETPAQPVAPPVATAPPVAPTPQATSPQQPVTPPPGSATPPQQPQWNQPPSQPYGSQWNQQQAPVNPVPMPASQGVDQNIFKIILYIMLGFNILGGVILFFSSFTYFGGWFNKPLLGILSLLNGASIVAVCAYAIMKMVKKQKFGFITIGFFALAFILNLIGLILGVSSAYQLGNIVALAIAVLASIPMNKIGDVESYKSLLGEATTIDYILLGAYAVTTLAYSITGFTVLHSLKSFL